MKNEKIFRAFAMTILPSLPSFFYERLQLKWRRVHLTIRKIEELRAAKQLVDIHHSRRRYSTSGSYRRLLSCSVMQLY